MRHYRYVSGIVCFYVAMQLISDVTAGKITELAGYPVSVTVLYFPITYIFADVLTEVYGYAIARRAIWIVLACSVCAGLIYQLAAWLPPAKGFTANEAYALVLHQVPRTLAGGWIAVFAGEILNDYVLAKLKVLTAGRHLWLRTTSSTLIGQLANTVLFYVIALGGILPGSVLFAAICSGWIIKVVVEVAMTPVTYLVVSFLKKAESEDYFDRETNFNPLIL